MQTLQNKDLFTDYQNLKFKHVAEISALKLEKDALVNRSNDLSSKLSEMTLSNQQLAAVSEAANDSFCVASASSQTSGDVVISIPVTLTEIETQTEATNSRTASPANTPASPPETKPATAPSQEGAASASSTPTSKHRMLASAALAMQKSNGKLRCSLYLQKIFDAARAREGKRVLRCFARWARNVERGNREALQNDLLGASKRFREQLERVKGQFVEQIETMRRESEAARAKLSASNDRADKLEMENRVLRSSRGDDSANTTTTGISQRRRTSIQNDILRSERVTPEVVLARRRQERAAGTAAQHSGFGLNLRGGPPTPTQTQTQTQTQTHLRATPTPSKKRETSTPAPATNATPTSGGLRKSDILPSGNGFAKLQASAKRAAERLKLSDGGGDETGGLNKRPHRDPPPQPNLRTIAILDEKGVAHLGNNPAVEVVNKEEEDDDDDIIPVDDETMERMATDAFNFFGGRKEYEKGQPKTNRTEERKRRIMSLDSFMNRKAINDM